MLFWLHEYSVVKVLCPAPGWQAAQLFVQEDNRNALVFSWAQMVMQQVHQECYLSHTGPASELWWSPQTSLTQTSESN